MLVVIQTIQSWWFSIANGRGLHSWSAAIVYYEIFSFWRDIWQNQDRALLWRRSLVLHEDLIQWVVESILPCDAICKSRYRATRRLSVCHVQYNMVCELNDEWCLWFFVVLPRSHQCIGSRIIIGDPSFTISIIVVYYARAQGRRNQGRRSLWDRGDTSPQYLDRGDMITNVPPPIFLE